MTLTQLVSQEKWQEFDQAWSAFVQSEEPIDDLISALQIAGDRKRLPRCLPMIKDHAHALLEAGRAADAARLIGVAVAGGGAPGELMGSLYEAAEKAWGSEPWWKSYTEIAKFTADTGNARAAWTAFERLLGFEQKKLVYHRGGWGVGEVTEVLHDALEISVRFHNGKKDRFPAAAAVEIFEILPDEDLRALHFRDPSAMRKLLRQDPLAVLRAVLERHGGRATNAAIKNALLQVGIEGSAWSGWWKRARKLAEESEWFRVTGTAARGEVQVLRSATDPVVELRRRLEGAATLADLLVRLRDMLTGGTGDARVRAMALEVLEQHLQRGNGSLPDRFTACLILRDERGSVPPQLAEILAAHTAQPASPDATAPPIWELFHSVASLRDQERCVHVLSDVYGERWADEGARYFQHAPPGMARALLEALLAQGKQAELAARYRELLARPLRAPEALLQLARAAEGGRLRGDFPPPVQRAEALLSLASYLFVNKKSDATLGRVHSRVVEFLCKGREALLRRLLEGAHHASLEGLHRTLQRGVDEEIDRLLTSILSRAAPPVAAADTAHFWESDRIWTTREGLERRRAELRLLREEKIPANQDAIGKAASMGDLSENSEWEMAIQEQEKLTSRAAEIESELRVAELIEDAILPENTVCPGTYVLYRDLEKASEHEIAILGPWDTDGEHIVSYRAPLAAGLLGRRPGDRATIKLPSGVVEVEVLAARPAELG